MSTEDELTAAMQEAAQEEAKAKLPKNPNRRHSKEEGIAEALALLAGHLDPQKVADANRRAQNPSNRQAPLTSALNPQGDKDFPRPVPIYGKIRIPYEAEPEDFTYEELELVNLLEPGEYRVTMNDRSKVMVTVVVHRNQHTQAPEILELVSPTGYAADRRHAMPPFADMLREMLGDKARKIATMEERRRWVEQKKVPVSVGA